MTEVLAHRGPDARGLWVEKAAALGHQRLAILDLSPRGNQPMTSSDGRHVIVFNGEVYNFPELREELEGHGHTFHTTTDTEVVLQAFCRWGTDCFARLNGMFAIAIWDKLEERLVLARDRFGQKPLYLLRTSSAIVFGSEIKALLASERVPREIDWSGLTEYAYFGNALGERTLFTNTAKLRAGHWLTFDRSGTRQGAFWQVDDVRPVHDSIETATDRVRTLLDAAVQRHLIADVPVGVFLSGGIDSSALTLLSARRSRLASYSVSFDFDQGELPLARKVAERAGTDHHELAVRGADIGDVIRALVRHHDQPFGDAANVPLYLLAKELGGELKAVLQGDGGDEVFAGYRRYNVLAFSRAWQILARAKGVLDVIPRSPRQQRLRRFLRAIGEPDPGRRMALLLTEESESPPPTRLFAAGPRECMSHVEPFGRYAELAQRLNRIPPVQRMLHTDSSILLPDIFCEKVDRSTMAYSLEVRLPLLDTELTDYVLGLPWHYKVRGLQKKWLLRRALRGIVPDSVLDAPKRGFGVPYGAWLRGPLRDLLEEVLLSGKAQRDGLVDADACRRAIDEHVAGRQNHGFLLYKMLNFALWVEAYL